MKMTVGEYLGSLVPGLDMAEAVLKRAAYSPLEVGLAPFELTDDAYPEERPEDFQKRLDYAASTVYYSVLGYFTGGGYTEKIGDVSVSRNNVTITMADRQRYKDLADMLRSKHGFEVETDSATSEIFDMSYLRR